MVLARPSQTRSGRDNDAADRIKQQQQRRETDALMQALAEFALSVARARRTPKKKRRAGGHGVTSSASAAAAAAADEKRAILEWLRSLPPSECASLSVITDVGFVKTLLGMAMMAKQRRASRGGALVGSHIDEFQLLPPLANKSLAASTDMNRSLKRNSSSNSAAPALQASSSVAPREFVCRPRVRTADGDVLGAFHSRAYSDACTALLPFVRVLNTQRSCDTITLATALFDDDIPATAAAAPANGRNGRFVHLMEHIADRQFLAACPSDAALRSSVWGETPWLAAQGYYSLQALIVNAIELSIWRHWLERKKHASSTLLTRVPLQGLSAKRSLMFEWERASQLQQRQIVLRLALVTAKHLKSFAPALLSRASNVAKMQTARASLTGLVNVIDALQVSAMKQNHAQTHALSVDVCFSCSLVETIASPQATILKLIVAEALQEQCSLLLSERLALEHEATTSQAMALLLCTDARDTKPANHTQRRRANRKQLLKKRRHDAEARSLQQKLLRITLDELKVVVRQRRERARRDVRDLLDAIVARAAADAVLLSTPLQTEVTGVRDSVLATKKSVKKKKKKKSRIQCNPWPSDATLASSREPATRVSTGLAPCTTSGPHGAMSTKAMTTAEKDEQPHASDSDEKENKSTQQQQQQDASPDDDDARPLLSLFDKSYASPLALPTFGPQPLYASTSSSLPAPFFLSLAPPRDHLVSSNSQRTSRTRNSSGARNSSDDLVAGSDRTSSESAASSNNGVGIITTANNNNSSSSSVNGHAARPSEPNSFEWFLPSLFSSESSSNHTNSTTSSLDWDFHNWQFKHEASTPSTAALPSTTSLRTRSIGLLGTSTAAARSTLRSSSQSAASGTTSRSRIGAIRAAAKPYSLESFSCMNMLSNGDAPGASGRDARTGGAGRASSVDRRVRERSSSSADSGRDNDDDDDVECNRDSAVDGAVQSDFLYRQGGFFDRQRALKRRRRPLPFDYDEDDENADDDSDSDDKDNESVEADDGDQDGVEAHSVDSDRADDDDDDNATWRAFPRRRPCCTCVCHSSNPTCVCPSPHEPSPCRTVDRECRADCAHANTPAVLERLTRLEAALDAKSQTLDELAATLPQQLASLQQTVSSLSTQLLAVESELCELKLDRELERSRRSQSHSQSPAPHRADRERSASMTSNLSDNSSPLPLPPPPLPLALQPGVSAPALNQSTLDQSLLPPPPHELAASEVEEYMYDDQLVAPIDASTSVLGPFVSVPMSVLPPRTKLHWDMCEFVSQLQTDSNARLPAQMAALRLCTATVQSLWPRAQVRPYGSFVSRLVLPTSDIDVVICLPKVRRDAPADAAGVLEGRNAIKETWQQNLARKLRLEPWVVPDSVKTIPLAAIPIITLLTTAPYNVRLDISFEGPGHNGLATNDVVLALLHEFPPLAPIMLVLKSFAIERGFAMAYSGGLSSYSLLLMVARYLQEHSDTVTSGFENVSAAVQHSISSQSCADFGMVLMGFLDFYGNRFDPRTTGISVASRCFLNRENVFLAAAAKDLPPPQYAADDAVLDDRSAAHLHHHSLQHHQYQAQHHQYQAHAAAHPLHPQQHVSASGHWQMPQQSAVQDANLLSSPGSRRHGNRSSMDWPQNTHMVEFAHDPHKFDPVFIEDPLHPSNNVGRNLFRITQIRRAFAAAYSTLLAASVRASVFADNRSTKITGVALHPDNMLRAVLGANAPVNAKSDAANVAVASASDDSVVESAAAAAAAVGFAYPNYPHASVAGTAQFFSTTADAPHSAAPPYPSYSHYQQPQHYLQAQQQQQQQQRMHGAIAYRHDSASALVAAATTSLSSSYRRYSESGSEKPSTRYEVTASDKYSEWRRDRLASPRLAATHAALRNATAATANATATTTTNAAAAGIERSKDDEPIKTRKGPARSLSFADVVVGGNTVSASTVEYYRKDQVSSSPRTLARATRYWRDDSAIEDAPIDTRR